MTDRELMQMALDALLRVWHSERNIKHSEAIDALRARLAQPEQEIEPDRFHVEDDGCPTEKAVLQRFWREHQKQEPVACPYCHYSHTLGAVFFDQNCAGCVNRMTAPPQREWQGLTDEEIREFEIWLDNDEEEHGWNPPENIVKYLEAKLREKNHG